MARAAQHGARPRRGRGRPARVHDFPRPVEALRHARSAVRAGGTVLVVDLRAAETFTAPGDEVERFFAAAGAVTGTSSGLGRRFAQVLDGAGARVVLASRRHDLDVELAAQLHGALPVACDLRDPAAVEEAGTPPGRPGESPPFEAGRSQASGRYRDT